MLIVSSFFFLSKEQQIKQLELELDQERRMAESLVEDMVKLRIQFNFAGKLRLFIELAVTLWND